MSRDTIYRLAQFAEIAKDPLERYCIIETIEIFGHYLFSLIKDISREYTQETGKTLLYLGELHFEREPGVLANQKGSKTQEAVLNMDLSEDTRQKMTPIILEVSELIEARWHEFFENAHNHTQQTLINSLH